MGSVPPQTASLGALGVSCKSASCCVLPTFTDLAPGPLAPETAFNHRPTDFRFHLSGAAHVLWAVSSGARAFRLRQALAKGSSDVLCSRSAASPAAPRAGLAHAAPAAHAQLCHAVRPENSVCRRLGSVRSYCEGRCICTHSAAFFRTIRPVAYVFALPSTGLRSARSEATLFLPP